MTTPVLFLVFNRPDTTRKVFEAIRKARPPRLYIAADGPRGICPGEGAKVREVRALVLSGIDWDCEVKTLFRGRNLGCRHAVSSAITWFFEHEEQGIIIEDDCLPAQSFFWFCEALLEKYRYDERIYAITATHFPGSGRTEGDASYFLSIYPLIWGWATWRSRWQEYALGVDDYKEVILKNRNFGLLEKIYWLSIYRRVHAGEIDTWDYQWILTVWRNRAYALRPAANLSRNIGFGTNATHTKDLNSRLSSLELQEIDPQNLICNSLMHKKDYDFLAMKIFADLSLKRIILINFPVIYKLKSLLRQ